MLVFIATVLGTIGLNSADKSLNKKQTLNVSLSIENLLHVDFHSHNAPQACPGMITALCYACDSCNTEISYYYSHNHILDKNWKISIGSEYDTSHYI